MHPIPCAHCGVNFMRPLPDAEAPKLCNNCLVRQQLANPRKEEVMSDTVEILIKCPRQDQIEIEEICINQGIDFSRYFLELHYGSQAAIQEMKKISEQPKKPQEPQEDFKEEQKAPKKAGKK